MLLIDVGLKVASPMSGPSRSVEFTAIVPFFTVPEKEGNAPINLETDESVGPRIKLEGLTDLKAACPTCPRAAKIAYLQRRSEAKSERGT